MIDTFHLTLRLPPTDNRLYRTDRTGRKYKTEDYKNWCTYASLKTLPEFKRKNQRFTMIDPSFENQLEITAKIYLANKRSDMTNYIKAVKDILSDFIYTDDKWVVVNFILPAGIDRIKPRIELIIKKEIT